MKETKVQYILITVITVVSIGFTMLYENLILRFGRVELGISVAIFFGIAAFVVLRNLLARERDPYEIINPILFLYCLYAMMLPINYLVRTESPTLHIGVAGVAISPMFEYMFICTLGLIGLIIGYYLPFGKRVAAKLPLWDASGRELKIAGGILLAYGLLSFATNIAAYGGIANYINIGYGSERYVIQREAVAFGQGLELIGIASIILIFVLLKGKSHRWLILVLASILLAYIVISLLIGQRRYVVYLLIIALVITNYGVARVKLRWTLLFVVIAYLFFFVYAYSREVWAETGLIQGLVETYNIAMENPILILPFAGGEFIPPAKAILEILTDSSFQFRYGMSYLVGLVRILPRVGKIWPDALQTLVEWRMSAFYAGFYERGVSFNFFTAAEGYANFGYLGVLFHMGFYGFIARLAYQYFLENKNSILVLLIYSLVFCVMLFEGIHGEFSQVFWNATHTYVGPLIIMVFLAKFMNIVSKRQA
jgi:oligosaccharide repeat unit polymerase